ncbi:coiled-coil domain-containing protein 77-like [Uloborus diversus]|uniref:coiled-coil domain-containing protein 77-like n=1 Tax=Uloborus diversus TaxID=327109 RepID=UPI0024096EF4|nr:coiled-coil domain-containing protein 77-like [Uloborus diversus]
MYVNLPSEHCSQLKSQAFPTTQLRAEDKVFKHSKACGPKAKTGTSEDLEKLIKIYKNAMSEAEDLGVGKSELKALSSKLKLTEEFLELEQIEEGKENEDRSISSKQTQSILTSRSSTDDIIRWINRTLAKVKQVESKECLQDDELCKNLEEKINGLAKRLKELSEEFSVQNLRQQFSEYSSATMNKLETLAKQTRDSVSAAEAQIGTYKANVKILSQKLKDTEELLRESVNECLSLKQKLKSEEEKREKQKMAFYSELKQKVSQVAEIEELEKILDDVMSSEVVISKDKRRPSGPYECMYCKQGPGHKMCEEKIKDLRANNRKLSTEMKLVQQELKEEKMCASSDLKQAEKAIRELTAERNTLKDSAQSLESKCSSLTEQLKVERNKTKNLERYRKLEIEGFQTDIKNLKTKIRDLEKQLMKAVLVFEQDNKDLELLKTVHSTAQRSRQAVANIKRLKAKLYELETDIKNI